MSLVFKSAPKPMYLIGTHIRRYCCIACLYGILLYDDALERDLIEKIILIFLQARYQNKYPDKKSLSQHPLTRYFRVFNYVSMFSSWEFETLNNSIRGGRLMLEKDGLSPLSVESCSGSFVV